MPDYPFPAFAHASIAMIREVARRLGGDLREQVVFVGGATLPLLLTDQAVSSVRPTNDVDLVIELQGYGAYGDLSERLRARGFCEDASPGAPICRWTVEDLVVDIMPTDEHILGFSNRWYRGVMETANNIALFNEEPLLIRLIRPDYFVATKLEAFFSRGSGDIYASRDLEDIVTLLDGREELVDEITSDESEELRQYIAGGLRELWDNERFEEAVEGHLPFDARNRLGLVLKRFRSLCQP